MILTNKEELICFGFSVVIGIICSVFFDVLMSIKRNKGFAYYLFLWLVLLGAFWTLWQKFFFGTFIWYTVAGFITSCILYFFTIHNFIYSWLCLLMGKINNITQQIYDTVYKYITSI